MKKVVVFGTFDILHPGHLDFFKQARALGDQLIVIVGTDKNVAKIKGELPTQNQESRIKNIKETVVAEQVLLAPEDYNYTQLLKSLGPDVIALGYDQKPSVLELKKTLKQAGIKIEIVRLKSFKPNQFKSSLLKKTSRDL